jgi:hypothetical protein
MALGLAGLIILIGSQALRVHRIKSNQLTFEIRHNKNIYRFAQYLERDLRSAFVSKEVPASFFASRLISGESFSRLDLTIMSIAKDSPSEVGYQVKNNNATNKKELWRRFQAEADHDALNGGEETLFCADLQVFHVQLFDGEVWATNWGWDFIQQKPSQGIRGLPLLAKIQIQCGEKNKLDTLLCPVMVSFINRSLHA